MDFSALSIFWLFSSIAIAVFHNLMPLGTELSNSSNVNSLQTFLKQLLWKMYMYGKLKESQNDRNNYAARDKSNPTSKRTDSSTRHEQTTHVDNQTNLFKVSATEIPKSCFCHFYLVGALVHFTMFCTLIYILLGNPLPAAFRWLINWINLNMNEADMDNNAWPVLIVFTLEFLHILRRLCECVFVSTFSKGTMSFVHYFFGIFLYSSFGLGLLTSVKLDKLVFVHPSSVDVVYIFLGISLFLWGSFFQHKSMHTFASLRKDKKDYKPDGHYIPHGHLFELVSCPHYFCEILIYLALCLIFRFRNVYLLTVAIFVWTNQICISLSVHAWYKEHFPGYPVTRKAVFPYIL